MNRKALSLAIAATLFAGHLLADDFDPNAKDGGAVVITYQNDVATLDPAIGYDWQNWSMIKSLFDGLMDYKPGTTELTKNLASDYNISGDGTVYTFTLKQGVKFQNGRELKASDVKYSLERTVNPKTQSPGAGFFSSIVGYEDMTAGKAEHLSGIEVVDDYTVKITLKSANATFLQVMAINFSFVVPKEEVEKWGADFGKHPVGTGAYSLAEWKLGQQILFKKNPNYFKAGLPHLDTIAFEVGQDPMVALLRLQKGDVDIAGDGVPPAKFLEFKNDPKFKSLVVTGDQLQTGYLTLKTTLAPFDNLKVRQAVNMAISKDRIVRIINGRAVPANQPLPPAMPGYDKDYKGYAYDVEGAKKLLAEAGFDKGFDTEMYVMNTDPQPRIAQAIQQDLAKVGVRVKIKSLAQANVIAAGSSKDQAPMVWSGGMAWIADFPDPSNFYGPILGCDSAVDGGWNWALYCNKSLDALAAKADSMARPEQQAERTALWKKIFIDVMADAPWVPIFNERRFTVRSARMGGSDALYVDPVHIPVNYNYIYLK